MNITLENITTGTAGGKQIVVIEGFGSFQSTYVELHGLGTHHLYISHSKKDASIKLCFCLLDIAKHLGCDIDEMVENLPESWDKEYSK